MAASAGARQRAWVLAVLATGLFEVFLLVRPGSAQSARVTDSLLLAAAGGVAALVAAHRAGRETTHSRRAWSLLAMACVMFTAGQVAFAVEEWQRGERPLSGRTVADLLTTLAVPFAVGGLLAFAGSSVTSRVLTALDAATVTAALLFVSWSVVLGPVYRSHHASSAVLATMVYVGGTLAMLALVLVLSMRWRGDLHELALLGLAFAALSVANAAYGVTNLRGTYDGADWRIDVGWFGALMLIGLAAAGPAAPPPVDLRRRWWLALFVPYGAVVLVVGTSSLRVLLNREFDRFLLVTGILLVALVLVRQVLTLRDHHRLTVDLERMVAERSAASQYYAAQLRALLRGSADVIAVVDETGAFGYVSPASWSLFEQPAEELLGRQLEDFVHPDDRPAVRAALSAVGAGDQPANHALRFRLRAGEGDGWSDVEAALSPVQDEHLGGGTVLNMRDISARAAEQEHLRRLALHDPLTSLANRRSFEDRLRHALDRAERTEAPISLLFVDLDHFKEVNDTAGHAAGDELLTQVAHRLQSCLRPADTAARLGGDEFAVVLEDTAPELAAEVADRVLACLAPPYEIGGKTMTVTASVGVTSARGGQLSTADLVRHADVAMYRAKRGGRSRVEVFEPGTTDPAPDREA